MSVYMHPKKCICGYIWTMGVPDFQKKTFEVLDCACLLSVQTLLGWLGAFGTGDRCDAWYRRLVWSAVKGQPCQCNWGILWEIFNIMHCYCWLLSAISVYLRVTWEIMDRLLDIFRYHHGGEGLEAAVFYHNFYSQQGCPGKKKETYVWV